MNPVKVILNSMLILTISMNLQAQLSQPHQLTDSPANKSNAHLGFVPGLDWVVLWEQETGPASTAIFYKNYLTSNDPVELLSEPGIHFKNPKILNWEWNGSLILYQKIQDNKSELYYLQCSQGGPLSEPIPLWTSGTWNESLSVNRQCDRITWISDGYLLTARQIFQNEIPGFSDPDTIAFGNIKQPLPGVSDPKIFWLEDETDQDRIMFAEHLGQNWSEPQTLITENEITKLCDKVSGNRVLSWSYKVGESWQVNNYQEFGIEFFPVSILNDEPVDFGVWSNYFPVKSEVEEVDFFYLLAYPKWVNDSREIFIYEEFGFFNNTYQLSSLNTDCRNPVFFDGEWTAPYSTYIYVVWEAKVDDYWQLFSSRFPFNWSGIGEKELLAQISIHPNPASDRLIISNRNDLKLAVRIFDSNGRIVVEKSFQQGEFIVQVSHWPKGLYYVNILNDGVDVSKKIIVQ